METGRGDDYRITVVVLRDRSKAATRRTYREIPLVLYRKEATTTISTPYGDYVDIKLVFECAEIPIQ